MIDIVPAQSGAALDHLIALAQEYIVWLSAEVRQRYPELDHDHFMAAHTYDDLRQKFPGEHVAPDGCLLIAQTGADVCGCVALGRLSPTAAEMRTLFVRPGCRGGGIGRRLAEASLDQARALGYEHVRLDTLRFMVGAQTLYRSLGFYDIAPYHDMSAGLKPYICFMECKLRD